MSLSMSRAEREEFLAGVHVGVLGVASDDGGPLTVPVWYTGGTQVMIRMTPEHWLTADFGRGLPVPTAEKDLSGRRWRRDHGAWSWCARR